NGWLDKVLQIYGIRVCREQKSIYRHMLNWILRLVTISLHVYLASLNFIRIIYVKKSNVERLNPFQFAPSMRILISLIMFCTFIYVMPQVNVVKNALQEKFNFISQPLSPILGIISKTFLLLWSLAIIVDMGLYIWVEYACYQNFAQILGFGGLSESGQLCIIFARDFLYTIYIIGLMLSSLMYYIYVQTMMHVVEMKVYEKWLIVPFDS